MDKNNNCMLGLLPGSEVEAGNVGSENRGGFGEFKVSSQRLPCCGIIVYYT